MSHGSTRDSSNRSSPVFEDQLQEVDTFAIPPDDTIVQQTTAVVKSVMELSNKVYIQVVVNFLSSMDQP